MIFMEATVSPKTRMTSCKTSRHVRARVCSSFMLFFCVQVVILPCWFFTDALAPTILALARGWPHARASSRCWVDSNITSVFLVFVVSQPPALKAHS